MKKVLTSFLVFTIVFTQTLFFLPETSATSLPLIGSKIAYAESTDNNKVKDIYDLVALVVDKKLMNDDKSYVGGIQQYKELANVYDMPERIKRFAKDIQKDSPKTIVKVLEYDKDNETLLDVISALENLYKNGDENINSRLRGVILIGNIPLPVVNKNGNRFISMLPLTDFDEKSYVYNPSTQNFDLNTAVALQKPEIWHGVLKAPVVDDKNLEGDINRLAEFFDKNHLYHEGHEDFADFGQKLFFGDFVSEEADLNEDEYKLYQNLIKNMDDIAYMRFNKTWAAQVVNDVVAGVEDIKGIDTSKMKVEEDAMSAVPDIHTRSQIMGFHKDYVELVTSFLSNSNDLTSGTARYNPQDSGVDYVPALVTMKDKFAAQYLRQANDAIENKVNEIVAGFAQKLPIVDETKVYGSVGGRGFSMSNDQVNFIKNYNSSPVGIDDSLDLAPSPSSPYVFKNLLNLTKSGSDFYINGVSSKFLTTPKLCLPFLGSTTATRSLSSDNMVAATNVYTLGINTFALSWEETLARTNNQFKYGLLIEDTPEYGVPAFYNGSKLEDLGLQKDDPNKGINGDIILGLKPVYKINVDFPKYEVTTEEAAAFGSDINKIALNSNSFQNNKISYLPLIKCTDCNEYEKVVKDDIADDIKKGPFGEEFVVVDGKPVTTDTHIADLMSKGFIGRIDSLGKDVVILPHSKKYKDNYYYLPSGYDTGVQNESGSTFVLMKSNAVMKTVVNAFVQNVAKSKNGGSDDDNVYDDSSYLTVSYYDASASSKVEKDVKFSELSPFSNLSSDGNTYSLNDGKNGLSGCFFTSTVMHDDRCLPMFAKYPVLDPAGSIEPFLAENTGAVIQSSDEKSYFYFKGGIPSSVTNGSIIYSHQFPIGKKVFEQTDDGGDLVEGKLNAIEKFKTHAEVFQLPNDVTSKTTLAENIDDMYMDACFNMLPDLNNDPLVSVFYKADYYDLFKLTAEGFVDGEGKKNQNIPYGGKGDNISLYDSAFSIILDSATNLSLGFFAAHFGLYDGIDNDKDGISDYRATFDAEGNPTGFDLDMDEAQDQYGVSPEDIPAASRALLGKNFTWKNPPYKNGSKSDEYWYPLPAFVVPSGEQHFDENTGFILKVKPNVLTEIPSLIVHNEPTNYTISKQMESGVTSTLPIDDPRYVAFLDAKGHTQKITYPNLIESFVTGTTNDLAQFQADIGAFADSILKIPGAEKLSKNEIINDLFAVTINSAKAESTTKNHSAYMLSADSKILRDALDWNALSIDDKHEYVLNYYLNDAPEYQAYVNDSANGYEAAYLLFDGGSKKESDYVDFSFNKSSTADDDPDLNPLPDETSDEAYTAFVGEGVGEDGYAAEDDKDEFVSLKKFFEELIGFFKDLGNLVKSFNPKVGLDFACGDAEVGCTEESTSEVCEEETLSKLVLMPSKSVVYSDGQDYVDVTVAAYNDKDEIYKSKTPGLTYSVSQDAVNPAFVIDLNYSSKALSDGLGIIRLKSTNVAGSGTLAVQAIVSEEETVESDGLLVQSAGKKISMTSDSDGAQIGTDEVINLSAALMADNVLEGTATNQVTFTIIDGKDSATFEGGNVKNAVNGVARATIKPLKKSGIIKVEAKVTDEGYYATDVKELIIGSGVPAKLDLVLDTNVLVANQKSKSNIAVRVLDAYGNLTSDQPNSVSIFAFGDVKLDLNGDRNSLMPGLQVDTTDGIASASVLSGNKIGEANVYAVLMTDEVEEKMIEATSDADEIDFKGGIGASKKISILGDGSVNLIPKYDEKINADGVTVSTIMVNLMQTNGEKVSGYNGEIVWDLNDKTYGTLSSNTGKMMKSGSSSATFKSTTVSGKPTITVSAPGFHDIAFVIETLPGPAASLALESDKDTLFTGGGDSTSVTAKLLDQYGNLAYTSSANIAFTPSVSSTNIFGFNGPAQAFTLNGFATVNIKSTSNSGKALIKADGVGLERGKLQIDFKKRISNEKSNNFEKISPRALYINLLGGSFYDMGKNDFASEMLFNGKSQAVLTTTSVPNDKKRIVSVDGFGQIEILDTNVKSTFVPATPTFQFNKIKFRDEILGVNVAEVFFVPKNGLEFALINDDFADHNDGIFVKDITPAENKEIAPKLVYDATTSSIFLKRGVTDMAKIDKYGRVSLLSNDVNLRLPQDADGDLDRSYFSMLLEWKTVPVAQIQLRQSVDVITLSSKDNRDAAGVVTPDTASAFTAGIYVKLASDEGNFETKDSFSRYSTEFNRGVYIVDKTQDIDKAMAPGSGVDSVEGATTNPGVGFSTDNKNMLLFAAGNSVGESNIPYASEAGILLGDPTVRIENATEDLIGDSNYTHDIGQMVHSDAESFDNIEFFDYNGDGFQDLLMTFADGRIKLLENENSNQRFVDRGVILNIPNKINSLSNVDINKDGFDDLIIGTQESCVQGEKCLYLYTNNNGSFERQKLELNTADKIYSIKTADLNNDDAEDLVIADSAGNVYVFWVDDGKVNVNGDKLGNFGVDLNSDALIDDILVHYSGMPGMPDVNSTSFDDQEKYRRFVQIKLAQEDLATDAASVAGMFGNNYTYNPDSTPLIRPLPFLLTKYTDGDLVGSTKKVVDLNGKPMAVGDVVEYTITIKNNSSSAINDLVVSDITPSAQKIDFNSLTCLPATECLNSKPQWIATDAVLREFAIKNVTVPANGIRSITYRAEITAIPDVNVTVGNFSDLVDKAAVKTKTGIELGNDKEDKFLDIFVKPEINDSGALTYFFSKPEKDELEHVIYTRYDESIGSNTTDIPLPVGDLTEEEIAKKEALENGSIKPDNPFKDATEDENEDVESIDVPMPDGTPESMVELVAKLNEDLDGDMLPDTWDDTPGTDAATEEKGESQSGFESFKSGLHDVAQMASKIVNKVEDAIDQMRCSGAGCLPIPWNYAFFAPGESYPGNGLAMFAAGTPNFPYFSFMYPSMSDSKFRLYVSPTLTLGLGLAVCFGAGGEQGLCFVAAVPAQKIPFICDAIENVVSKIRNLINKAVSFVNDAVNKVNAIVSGEDSPSSTDQGSGTGSVQHNGAYGSGNSKLTFKDSVNIKIPGFPGFFTNWMDAQIDEIFTKLLDLPDFYIILPDFGQIFNADDMKDMASSFKGMKNVDDFFEAIQKIPLIQIQPQEVQINIPIINQQQIDKYKVQAAQILKHLQEQVEQIKTYWSCDANTEQSTICNSAIIRIGKLVTNLQKLLDTIEAYKNLPKTLAKLRFALSKYALQIVCYLDAVMDLTGGYVKRQGKTIQSWMKAIREIIDQFKGWKVILDLIIDYQVSCDECKNERYGEIGLIFQVFGSVFPDLPIIQIPKWPDFVFDFSKIEMGMTVIWPDFVFKPVPLNLPDLPNVSIPMIEPSIDIDLDGLIPDFEFPLPNINFELPDLPPLPLPKLPNIPRPPTIPKIPKPVFDLAISLKPIFKILCLIKKGLLLYPEGKVKGQIEGMTEPGVKPVLPITLNLNLKAPSFSYDAPVEFDITLKTKFGVDTNGIFNYVKDAADTMNNAISDWSSKFNGYMKAATNAASSATQIDRTLMEKAGVSPNWDVDLENVKKEMKGSYNFDMNDPDNLYYYLAATQDYIGNNDPLLNKNASELDFIASTDELSSDVVELRNSLLAYAKSFEDQGNMFENIDGLDDLNTLIASMPNEKLDIDEKFVSKDLDQQNLAGNGDDLVVEKVSIAAIDLKDKDLDTRFLNEGVERLKDTNGDGTADMDRVSLDTLTTAPTVNPKGIFIVNTVKENGIEVMKSENVVSYVAELNKNTKTLFGDVDNDEDTDIIYTMGNDIYWKKNYEVNTPPPANPDVYTIASVSDYADSVKTSVQNGASNGNKNNSSTLSFLPQKYTDVVGYEVVLFPSLTDIDKNLYRGTYRYLLIEDPDTILGKVDEIFGIGNVVNSVVKEIHQSPDEFTASGGDLVYAVSDAGLIVNDKNIGLSAGSFYEIPSDSKSPTLGVALGTIEYIKKNTDKSDRLFTKTSFIYGDRLRTLNNAGAKIAFENGVDIEVKENETFEISELTSPSSPSLDLNIPNGNYYAVVHSIHSDGTRSLASTPISVSPQICGTTSAPLPIAQTSLEIAVTKVAELNASSSFDPGGAGLKAYYIDMDLEKDNNSDGDKTNDPDLWSDLSLSLDGPDADGNLSNDMTNPIFKLGPFDEVGDKKVMLNVVNNANIAAQQEILIKVYVPKIALEPVMLETGFVSGSTNPATSDMPYTLMRKRYLPRVEDGVLKLVLTDTKLKTASANENGQYITDGDGTYEINDFNLEDVLYIKDASGNVVVEIDLKTGNFEIKKDGYKYSVYDAEPPSDGGKVVFKDPSGAIIGTMYFVSDPNYSVVVEYFDEFTAENTADMYGVHVTDPGSESLADDDFEFRKYPPNDPNYPDGLYLYYLNEGKQMAAIDTAGNILSLDKRITVGKKPNDNLTDPFVHIIRFNGTKIAEVYVSPKGKFDEVQITGPNDVPKKFPNGVSPGYLFEDQTVNPNIVEAPEETTEGLFTDLSGDLYEFALNLYKQGLLDPNSNFDPETPISREDFVMLLLNMLCIVPRDEAYTDPQVFSDVQANPWVKEAAMLGLIRGYEDDDDTTLNPFRPDQTINLAEAVSVIINGLKLINVVDGAKLVPTASSAWYDVYINAALSLNKYVLSGVLLKNSFILTQEEAVNPESQLTRGKALEISYRVLDAYNCTVIDKDNNGMSDYCEAKYKITDPEADADNDGLVNKDECKYGTDPTKPDTDQGGVKDGDEVKLGTNPLDKIDDQNDIDGDGLTDKEELNIYKTDPNKADTDNGGINDGTEVKENKTDPLNGKDDYAVGDVVQGKQIYETAAGVYLVPGSCDSCPCNASIEYKADLRKGDILYTIIVNKNETKIYSKSNEQKVE